MTNEYKLLLKVIQEVSNKVDMIFDKVNEIDKKTFALEEWRKYKDQSILEANASSKNLELRIQALENYKWFLMGGSAAISAIIVYIFNYFKMK